MQTLVLAQVAEVSAGADHSLALKTDGTVWAWGNNSMGALGNGTTTQEYYPIPISGLSGIVGVKAGNYCSMALGNNGTVWAWGNNENGQLGDGTTTNRLAPVQVSGLTGIASIVTGGGQSFAVTTGGAVWAWGSNGNGQLGDGTTISRLSPVLVSALTGVSAVVTKGNWSCALKTDGTVWVWGANVFGRVSAGTNRLTPVQVSGLANIVSIAIGSNHGIALKNDGSVWAWGRNESGQLGDGTTITHVSPAQLTGLSGIVAIDANAAYNVVLKSDGSISTWGDLSQGQAGDGTTTANRYFPVQVTPFTDIKAVASGNLDHMLAIREDGTVWAWGANSYGKLGDGTQGDRPSPVQVNSLSDITAVAAGKYHSFALKNGGTVWTWGLNDAGQLGDGTLINRSSPVQINVADIVATASGTEHGLAVKNDGTVWTWGWNSHGQLGDGTTTDRATPALIAGLTDVVAVAGGWAHSLALKSDGTIWAWGCNETGELGDGTVTDHWLPQPIPSVTGIVAIAANGYVCLALKNDGTVLAWGGNYHGASGNGTLTPYTASPVQVIGLTNVIGIAVAWDTSFAVKNDGTVWAWGEHGGGDLGNGEPEPNTNTQTVPVQANISGVVALAGGHPLALLADGTLRGWGGNAASLLGTPTYIASPTRAAIRLFAIADDANRNGISDAWELQYFGTLTRTGADDYDGDGLTDIQEFFKGTHPTQQDIDSDLLTDFVDSYPLDYYNAETPSLTLISGDNQIAVPGTFNADPFDVAVWNASATSPLVDAPVTFTVTSGGGALVELLTDTPANPITLPTDEIGTVQAYYKHALSSGVASVVTVTAGLAQLQIHTESDMDLDSDADGLPDVWELQYWIDLSSGATADPDNDGLSNLEEYELGYSPLVFDALRVLPSPVRPGPLLPGQTAPVNLNIENLTSGSVNWAATVYNNTTRMTFDYGFKDSITGGEVFSWTNIATTGVHLSVVSNGNDAQESINLSNFAFPFYGEERTTVYVCSEGYLSFVSAASQPTNRSLPNTLGPRGLIAPFWDSLNPALGGDVYYKEESDRLIVQYDHVKSSSGSSTYTFQVILWANGDIQFHYLELSGTKNSCTVGVQNLYRDRGCQVVFNGTYLQNAMSVKISSLAPFVQVSASTGTVPGAGASTLSVNFNSRAMAPGIYTAILEIAPIGVTAATVEIPLVLEVVNDPASIVLIEPFSVDTRFVGDSLLCLMEVTDDTLIRRTEMYANAVLRAVDYTSYTGNNYRSINWNNLPLGTYEIVVRLFDVFGRFTDTSPITVTVVEDSDEDGLGDVWEQTHFGGLDETPTADFDGDGEPNIFEFRHATLPDNPSDKLSFNAEQPGSYHYYIVDQELVAETAYEKRTISAAIEEARDFDIIEVRPGTYSEWFDISSQIWVFSTAGARATIVEGTDPGYSTVGLWDKCVLQGLTIRNGGYYGISVDSFDEELDARIVDCLIVDNALGGIVVYGGRLTVVSTTVAGNRGTGLHVHDIFEDPHRITLVNSLFWNLGSHEILGGTPQVEFIYEGVLSRDSVTDDVLIDGVAQNVSAPALTPYYGLYFDSPARNAGSGSVFGRFDFEGEAREDGLVDIGVDEILDADEDQMPDSWEAYYNLEDPAGDADADGLSNFQEHQLRTNPADSDTDDDGFNDGYEVNTLHTNPLIADPWALDTDFNSDGLDDSIGLTLGYAYTATDSDGDGVLNTVELANGTNPLRADTDGDGVADAVDAFPLDPNLTALDPVSGDVTGPAILLLTPANAIEL